MREIRFLFRYFSRSNFELNVLNIYIYIYIYIYEFKICVKETPHFVLFVKFALKFHYTYVNFYFETNTEKNIDEFILKINSQLAWKQGSGRSRSDWIRSFFLIRSNLTKKYKSARKYTSKTYI